jgi:hypothetical protein
MLETLRVLGLSEKSRAVPPWGFLGGFLGRERGEGKAGSQKAWQDETEQRRLLGCEASVVKASDPKVDLHFWDPYDASFLE